MLDCGSIMRPIKKTLRMDDPLRLAIDFMRDSHMGLVPVVDAQGRFSGLLSGDRLMHFMLPKHLTMVRGLDRMGYLRESPEELRERLDEIGMLPIHEVTSRQAMVVYPDTPLVDAQKILAGTQFVVPVVDRETGRLLGAISFFTILLALLETEEASTVAS